MLSNLGLHINKYPTGKFGYCGSIPVVLANIVEADTAAIIGGRSFLVEPDHENPFGVAMYRFPVFDSWQEAVDFALSRGCEFAGHDGERVAAQALAERSAAIHNLS